MMNEIAELFAIAGRTTGIDVKHDITARGIDLFLDIETVAVVGKRSAMNLEN